MLASVVITLIVGIDILALRGFLAYSFLPLVDVWILGRVVVFTIFLVVPIVVSCVSSLLV